MPRPPDLDAIFRKWGESFQRSDRQIGGPGQFSMLVVAVILALWILSGFYQVGTEQLGVVMRFGAFNRIDQAGLHYHLPYPSKKCCCRTSRRKTKSRSASAAAARIDEPHRTRRKHDAHAG